MPPHSRWQQQPLVQGAFAAVGSLHFAKERGLLCGLVQGLFYAALLVVLSVPSGTLTEEPPLLRFAVLILCGRGALPPEQSAPEVPSPLQRHHTETRENLLAARLCLSDRLWLSWRASGFLRKQQPDWLQYYLQSWRGLFAAADAQTAASFFGMQYLTLAFAATTLLLLGLFCTGAGSDLPVCDVLRAGKRNVRSCSCFERQRKAGRRGFCCLHFCLRQLILQGCAYAWRGCSAGEQPDTRPVLICSLSFCFCLCAGSPLRLPLSAVGFDQGASEDAFLAGLHVVCYNREN